MHISTKEKLNQIDFAKIIGISTRTLVHYEDGERYQRDEFLNQVYNMEGKKELEKARSLTEGISSLFAGEEISDENKGDTLESITHAYWDAKRENKKYSRKKKD